jgi:hypothetical protein
MSGELINTERYIEKKDIFEKGYSDFSSQSINELFDSNGDGEVNGVEKDRMQSAGVLNTLESINPLVARAFNDENFRIDNGFFLTSKQQMRQDKVRLLIDKIKLLNKLEEIKNSPERRFQEDTPNIENTELDTNNLQEDLINRQYLEQSEINNQV